MSNQAWLWIIFGVVMGVTMALDLGVFHRKSHAVDMKEALIWSVVWIMLALGFMGMIWWLRGRQPALEYLTGYVIEKSLSVDNLFVFLLLFSFFRVPKEYEHDILFWGILGAIVLRLIFIIAGVALINRFHWIIYVFGAVLVYSGIKMAFKKDEDIHPESNPVLKLFRKFFPVTKDYHGKSFFVRAEGRWLATPLFIVLLVVETTDLIFAVDSIPAVLAITRDPFIVYSSNIFAIMGLRSLYFALAGVMNLFHHLHYGLSAILVFVGAKMILGRWFEIPTVIALSVVAGLLALSIVASLIWPEKKESPST